LAGESDSEVRLADTGWADEQTVRRGLEEAAGAELVDQRAVNTGLGIEVESRTARGCGQTREP